MTRAATQEERADRDRDLRKHDLQPKDFCDNRRRLAIAALVGECESLVGKGILSEPAEQSMRLLIAEALSSHGMPSIAEREVGASA